jgi:ribosomal protein S18 acetylase RimI-like enzyme
MNEAVTSFILRPWLVLHPEFKEKYQLLKKNLKAKFGKKKVLTKSASKTTPISEMKNEVVKETGLVVIGVISDSQGKGYGSLLLKEFENKTNQLNIKKMGLAVKSDNQKAIKSYERNGWKIDKQKDNYFEMVKYL